MGQTSLVQYGDSDQNGGAKIQKNLSEPVKVGFQIIRMGRLESGTCLKTQKAHSE